MKEFEWTIEEELGIHARPAGMLVKTAAKFSSEIKLFGRDKEADGKKLFSVMSLGAKKGDKIRLCISGNDENEAQKALLDFCKKNL